MNALTAAEIDLALALLDTSDPQSPADELWTSFDLRHWPALFHIIAVAADIPRLGSSRRLRNLDQSWPALAAQTDRLITAQRMVASPLVLPNSVRAQTYSSASSIEARHELETERCVHIDNLLADSDARSELDMMIGERTEGDWGQLSSAEAPELHQIADQIVGSAAFRELTGFDALLDERTLTLSLQSLDRSGIAWHQDLYWPREWVGEDVFAVLYALAEDSPEKGGAFLVYSPRTNRLSHTYRRAHESTVLWNCRTTEERPLHAVGGYSGPNTTRPLLILQCHRRRR